MNPEDVNNQEQAASTLDFGQPAVQDLTTETAEVTPAETPVVEPVVTPEVPAPAAAADQPPAWVDDIRDLVASVNTRIDDLDKRIGASAVAPAVSEPVVTEETFDPQSWNDIPKLVEEKAAKVAEKVIEQRESEAEAARQAAFDKQQKLDNYLDNQVETLTKSGKLPAVVDPTNPSDPGRQRHAELYALAAKMGTLNLEAVIEPLSVAWANGQRFDPKAQTFIKVETPSTVAAKGAPIGSSNSSAGNSKPAGPSYKEISGARDMDELIHRATRQ